ncbi:MAG: CHAT domain-containing protein [Pseudomonadota bacterium]
MFRSVIARGVAALAFVLCGTTCAMADTDPFSALIARAAQQRQAGNLTLAIDALRQAETLAADAPQREIAAAELGATLLQARRFEQAEAPLRLAYDAAQGTARAVQALALGNLALQRGQAAVAAGYYREAGALAGADSAISIRAGLNALLRVPDGAPLPALEELNARIARSAAPGRERAELYLNLGHQARKLGTSGMALAHQALSQAMALAAAEPGDAAARLQAETLDALAQLYESGQRGPDALMMTRRALALLRRLPPGGAGDLAIPLEARLGRLYRAQGEPGLALAAYQRAADQIDALRLDIPIEFDDGSSSYRSWFEPVYLGLAELLLDAAAAAPADAQQAYLRRARDAVELTRQAELQDYLGDRCTVDAVKGGSATVIPAGTAVLYPLVFSDRVDLLLETATQLIHLRSGGAPSQLRSAAAGYAADLRNGRAGYLPRAKQLYDWLLRPVEAVLAAQKIDTLVVVPDGVLRLLPFGALHDGAGFAIERLAVVTVTGMSMTNTTAPPSQSYRALVAGASRFGPVVDKFMGTRQGRSAAAALGRGGAERGLLLNRTLRGLAQGPAADEASPTRMLAIDAAPASADAVEQMRAALALPGVASEINTVSALVPSTSMLDAGFTVGSFSQAAQAGNYGILHLASHGLFGGSGATSFVLAYDDMLTLDGLQALLRSERLQRHPIELLTLSACETAEGNERAPLGMSGAAMKARAKSVLGSLWPVADEAAVILMPGFYDAIVHAHLSKAKALQRAQLELVHHPDLGHPAFWAPFTLIGNWL